jgi:hypothetical protein
MLFLKKRDCVLLRHCPISFEDRNHPPLSDVPLGGMSHDIGSDSIGHGIDWKGVGYLFSIAGVLALGAAGCFAPNAPGWYFPALAIGVVTSIIGFVLRYVAHLEQKRELEQTKREAERR